MKKAEIAKKLARRAGVTRAEAADGVDRVVREVLSRLRRGHDAEWPGLGRFTQNRDGDLTFERDPRANRD